MCSLHYVYITFIPVIPTYKQVTNNTRISNKKLLVILIRALRYIGIISIFIVSEGISAFY
jgi:hypothetical protein